MNAAAPAVKASEKKHADGGTFTELAFVTTHGRWGVSVTRWTTYRGDVKFEVQRVSPHGIMFRLGLHDTEAAARKQANIEWAADKGN